MEYTVRQLIAEIRDAAAQLGPNHLPTGLGKLRKAELELLLTSLRNDLEAERQAERDRQEELFALDEVENIAYNDTIEADDPTSGIAAPDGLGNRDFTEADWDDALTGSEVDSEFAAEVDALVARDLRDDMPTGLVERVQFAAGIPNRESTEGHDIGGNVAKPELHPYYQRRFAAKLPVTTTNVKVSDVSVVVQSGSRLLWGKLINVINRRTRYSAPLLVTVELESGVRQLVAADDILAA